MLYVRQIPPEYQKRPLFYDEWPENIIVTGNKDFNSHTTELYDRIINAYEECAEIFEDIKNSDYKNVTELINDYFPASEYREKPYNTREIHAIKNALELYGTRAYYEGDYITAMLVAITGKEWRAAIIRGCCQSDWQNIIYPAEYGREWLAAFEAEYFNTGTEWIIHDDETPPECPEDITGYSIYCHSYDPREEIAQYTGEDPENIKLYEFSNYSKIAKYAEV